MDTQIPHVFLFTRDLRLDDNIGLHKAVELANASSMSVKCLFQFRKQQIGEDNSYRSDNAIQFMIESLKDLEEDIRSHGGTLTYLYEISKTHPNQGLLSILQKLSPKSSTMNGMLHISYDYTPFAKKRATQLQKDLHTIGWELCQYHNHCLTPTSLSIRSGSGKMYPFFAPFYNRIRATRINSPISFPSGHKLMSKTFRGKYIVTLRTIQKKLPQERMSPERKVKGGRKNGLEQLHNAIARIKASYITNRHDLDYETSLLSAYHHFGCISVRETWKAFSKVPALRRQLVWRDFAYHRMMAWPSEWSSVTTIGDDIEWKHDKHLETAWKDGNTGVPAVDAAMRQLIREGYIHNRGRMIVANYLVKNLRLDWRIGEKFFARWLTDYDWSVNFMNWIGIAGILPTDSPYRTMNPFIQSKKHDSKLHYIQKYIPELKDVDDSMIHDETRREPIRNHKEQIVYPTPIVDYTESRLEYRKWAKRHLLGYVP